MSAIFGMGFLTPINTEPEQASAILEELLKSNEQCGHDATGIGITDFEYTKVLKEALPAHKFICTDTYKELIKKVSPLSAYSIVGHCRTQVDSSVYESNNNQPFVIDSTLGYVDGKAYNKDAIFKFEKGVKPVSNSSSEPMATLYNYYTSKLGYETAVAIRKTCKTVSSTCNCAITNNSLPHILLLIRHGCRHFEVRILEDIGLILFSSAIGSIADALEKTGIKVPSKCIEMPADHFMAIDLNSSEYMIKSTKGNV